MKKYKRHQDRMGNPATRLFEFEVVKDQVKRRKEAFIRRLSSHLVADGECLLYQGTKDQNGYPRLSFKYRGKHVMIHAMRVFLILMIRKPIPRGREAGHMDCCTSRACVRHLQAQPYKENAATYAKRKKAGSAVNGPGA